MMEPPIDGLRVESAPLAGVPDGVRLTLSGRSTATTFMTFQQALQEHLDAGVFKLLIDCERLEFLSSTALGFLINLSDRIQKEQGVIGFIRVPKKVRTVFDLLGLQDFFPVFESEREAFPHYRKPAAPASALPPTGATAGRPSSALFEADASAFARPGTGATADKPAGRPAVAPTPPAKEPEPARRSLGEGGPVAEPRHSPSGSEGEGGILPLGHPRWIVLLQTVSERLGFGVFEEICRRLELPPAGGPAAVFGRIVRSLRSSEDLLGLFDESTLGELSRLYHLPSGGSRSEQAARILAFVGRSTTDFMAGILSAAQAIPRLEPGMLPVELTRENLLKTLEKTILPKRVRDEKRAKACVRERLEKVFGKERVSRKARARIHSAELELGGAFAVEVRLGRALCREKRGGATDVQRLLGQLVVLCRRYGPENVVAVVVGDLASDAAGLLEETRELAGLLGATVLHLR